MQVVTEFWASARKSILAAIGAAVTEWSTSGVFSWRSVVAAALLGGLVYITRNDPPGEADLVPREGAE